MRSRKGSDDVESTGEFARATAPVSTADQQQSVAQVVFYQLTRKFVDTEKSIPDDAKDVMYYTLAVGHHTGVIDCFEERLRCDLSDYEQACARLPEGDARYKLEAIQRSSEVQIEQRHVAELLPAIDAGLADPAFAGSAAGQVFAGLRKLLVVLQGDVAAYIMGRVRIP